MTRVFVEALQVYSCYFIGKQACIHIHLTSHLVELFHSHSENAKYHEDQESNCAIDDKCHNESSILRIHFRRSVCFLSLPVTTAQKQLKQPAPTDSTENRYNK